MTQVVKIDTPISSKINLRIDEQLFDELYPQLVGWYDHLNNPPPSNISATFFEEYYLKSKLWRLNNLYKVIDKYGNPVDFKMNYAQHVVYSATKKHPRIIILKSRQQGISTFFLVSFFDDAIFSPHLNVGLMAQGTDEATTLLERSKFLWEQFPEVIKETLNIRLRKDNTKEVAFSNGSTLFIRVSFRSTTLQRLHISEFGKIANNNPQRAKETKSGTLQALARGNTGVIESTAEGRNLFKEMWDASVQNVNTGEGLLSEKDFYPVFLPWYKDPDCVDKVEQLVDAEADKYFKELLAKGIELTKEQQNFWIVQRRELGGDIFQEYPATPEEAFAATRDGSYYSRLYNEVIVRNGRLIPNLYDENLKLEVYCDIGMDDYFVLGFIQYYNKEYRLVHEYWNNGFDLEHYLAYAIDTGWEITNFVFPHDIMVRELGVRGNAAGRARKRLDVVKEILKERNCKAGIRVLAKSGLAEGIELVKQMLKHLFIDPTCTYNISCLLNYSKEWDDKLGVWKTTPRHDEYSHGADMLRLAAVGVQDSLGVLSSDEELRKANRSRNSGGYDV